MHVLLTIKEMGAGPVTRRFGDTFAERVVREMWQVGKPIQFGREVGWKMSERFIVEAFHGQTIVIRQPTPEDALTIVH